MLGAVLKWGRNLFSSLTDSTNWLPHLATPVLWTSSAMLDYRFFASLGINGGDALAFRNDSGAEVSRVELADAKAIGLENDCGWRRK